MKPYITTANIAVGYTAPKFPSLTMSFLTDDVASEYLFYFQDIWKFTLWWTMIVFGAVYLASGVLAAVCQRSVFTGLFIVVFYVAWGEVQAVVSGSVVGLLLAATYRTGSLTMNTWIPLIWGITQILYVVVLSYSSSSIIL